MRIKIPLSYFFAIVSTIRSVYNGDLRIVLFRGKKKLNTRDANYSYGSLHRIMRFALREADFRGSEDILLLGLGAGSVIELIRNEFHLPNLLRAVDIDPVIIEIARKEFALDSYVNTEILCQDAYTYVANTEDAYGLIIIDLFINNQVPLVFFDAIFWENILRISSSEKQIIFNTMASTTDMVLFDAIITELDKH